MAHTTLFTAYGGLRVKQGETYDYTNVPAECNAVLLTRGVRITDETGSKTSIRGVRVRIVTTGLTAPSVPLDNVPIVWQEGEYMIFSGDSIYTFMDDGLVAYGLRVV